MSTKASSKPGALPLLEYEPGVTVRYMTLREWNRIVMWEDLKRRVWLATERLRKRYGN